MDQENKQAIHQRGDGTQDEAEQWQNKADPRNQQPQRGFDDTNEGARRSDPVEDEATEQDPATMPQSETEAEGHMGQGSDES
jgi:hypothetical protein